MATTFAKAQGLEGIIVEKFYQANAADSMNAASEAAVTPLRVGAVTYRIFVDMAAGYKFSQIYGDPNHQLKVTTTTNFFNDPNSGSTTNPLSISTTNTRKKTALIDSWFTTGGVATGNVGVLKSEDTDGSPGNAQSVLQNNPGGDFGLPINIGNTTSLLAADGMIAGTPIVSNVLGLTTELDIFDQTTGNSFITNNGAIAALGGTVGVTPSNTVLIGQFTTDGELGFNLNVQLVRISDNKAENYVASNPEKDELTHYSLVYGPNVDPSVSITKPSTGATSITGVDVEIEASSTDTDGTVTQVEFFVDNVSIGVDNTSPYSATYKGIKGTHSITAVSTDNRNGKTTSSPVSLIVDDNQKPTISVSLPSTANNKDEVTITATASDVDGSIDSVEFFIDNVSIGVDKDAPYSIKWPSTSGVHTVKAVATDDLGLSDTSDVETITVSNDIAPTVSITSPVNDTNYITGSTVTITADAADQDGTISQVEFFVDGVSVSVDQTAPYTYDWTSTDGFHKISAVATDDDDLTTDSDTIQIYVGPNILPVISITVLDSAFIGDTVKIEADATDENGSIKKVEFFVDGISIGVDTDYPYSAEWTATEGSHTIKAIATDDLDSMTTSNIDTIIITDKSWGIVEQEGINKLISVYPNPVKEILTINVLENTVGSFILTDVKGSILAQDSLNSTSTGLSKSISVSEFTSGVYYLSLSIGEERITKKIVIE